MSTSTHISSRYYRQTCPCIHACNAFEKDQLVCLEFHLKHQSWLHNRKKLFLKSISCFIVSFCSIVSDSQICLKMADGNELDSSDCSQVGTLEEESLRRQQRLEQMKKIASQRQKDDQHMLENPLPKFVKFSLFVFFDCLFE